MQICTLKKNKEFNRVYKKGKSFPAKTVVLVFLRQNYGGQRVGFCVSKKVGKSVIRNRARRRMKWAYTRVCCEQQHYMAVFIARPCIVDAEFGKIICDMQYALNMACANGKGRP